MIVTYPFEMRKRDVELFYKYDCRANWVRDFEAKGLVDPADRYRRYTEDQRRAAVDYHLYLVK